MEHNHIYVCCMIVLVAVVLHVRAQPDPDVCIPGPGDTKGHQLPDLPERYKVNMERHGGSVDRSVTTVHYYDDVRNLGAVQYIKRGDAPSGHNNVHTLTHYYDYSDSQVYTVYPNVTDFGSHTCTTSDLTNNTRSPFGYDDGHIMNPSFVFKFGEKYNETYENRTHLKGIAVDWWSACIYEEDTNMTYKADLYFVADQEKVKLPVLMILNGTVPSSNVTEDPGRQRFHRTFVFQIPDIGPQPLEVFFPPIGVICPGRVNLKQMPKVPMHFALNIEVVSPDAKKIFYFKEFYHFEGKIVAYELRKEKMDYREVHDYNTGIAYTISRTGSCHMKPIPIVAGDAWSKDREHVVMRPPASFFALHAPDVDWVYEGKTINRDTEIHAWQTLRTNWKPIRHRYDPSILVNSTWMYYFLDKDWTIDGTSTYEKSNGVLPIRLEILWAAHDRDTGKLKDRGKEMHNFFQPDEGPVEPYYFDVGHCYTHMNESLQLAFNVEGKDTYNKYIANNTRQFTHGVIKSLAESLHVSITRIAQLTVVDGYEDVATVFFTLLGRPQIQGDALNATDPGPDLGTGYALLQELINDKEGSTLVLEFIYHGEITKVNAASDTLREETQPLIQTKQVGLTTGVASGIAIGTFILGAIIAAICVSAVFKYKNTEVPYAVQE